MESENVRRLEHPSPPPTPLQIRDPNADFIKVAEDCIRDGSFDIAFKRIQSFLRKASSEGDRAKISYFTRAFIAFLHAKGGNYSPFDPPLVPPPVIDRAVKDVALGLKLPAAAFEAPDE